MVRKNHWKKFVEERLIEAKAKGIIDQFFKLNPRIVERDELKKLGFTGSDGEGSLEDPKSDNAGEIDVEEFFSDEEDDAKKFKGKRLGGTFRKDEKVGRNGADGDKRGVVNEEGYYLKVLKHEPDEKRWNDLKKKLVTYKPHAIKERFEQELQNNRK